MLYANSKKLHGYILLTCTLFALISPDYNQEIVQAKPKEKTNTGMEGKVHAPVQSSGTVDKPKTDEGRVRQNQVKVECNADCKIKHLENIGIDNKIAKPLVENCKRLSIDPVHCIIAGSSVITAESGGKLKNCYHKNCTGIGAGGIWYNTYEAGIIDWINRYNKYWYKAKSASFFYPSVGEKSKSRYCTSENSSGSAVGCPNGQKSAQSTWNKLNKLFG